MPEVQETTQPTMEEYVASRQATAATTPPEKVETAPESATGTPESEEKKEKGGGWQRRIDKLTKRGTELEEALREEREARQRLEAKLAGRDPAELTKKPVEQGPRPRPKATDSKYAALGDKGWDQYEEDLLAWQKEQIVSEVSEKQRKLTEETEQERANREFMANYKKRGDEYFNAHPDDRDLILAEDSPAVDIPPGSAMDAAILESEFTFQILKHLCENEDEISRIASLGPLAQAREIFKIESHVGAAHSENSSPEPKKASLPAPIRPVSTSTSKSAAKPDTMSMDDYAKWRSANRAR